jgi:high-affinity iron transporter
MKKIQHSFFIAVLVATFVASNILGAARAVSDSPAQIAEYIRSSLLEAQLSLTNDSEATALFVKDAKIAYRTSLSDSITVSNPDAHLRITSAFEALGESIRRGDATSFAAARAQAWTGILAGSYSIVEEAIQSGDGLTAQKWLSLREFRTATRFSRPNVGATVTVESFISGNTSANDALLSVRADMLDTYQARLTESLHDLQTADVNGFALRRAELATLAEDTSLSYRLHISTEAAHRSKKLGLLFMICEPVPSGALNSWMKNWRSSKTHSIIFARHR